MREEELDVQKCNYKFKVPKITMEVEFINALVEIDICMLIINILNS